MASGVHLFDETINHFAEVHNHLRLSSFADNLNTTQPFPFKSNTTAPTSPWSHVDFVPEKVIDLSVTLGGLRFYKVQWHHSWVAEHQLLPFQDILQAFWTRENDVAIKKATSKILTTSKESPTKLPSINNLSFKATNLNDKETCISSAPEKRAPKVVEPVQISLSSSSGSRDEADIGKSGRSYESKDLVNPTLATVRDNTNSNTGNIAKTAVGGTVNSVIVDTASTEIGTVINSEVGEEDNVEQGNPDNLNTSTSSANQSDLEKSYEEEISKVLARDLKPGRTPGRTVRCDGLEILGVENTNVSDDVVRAQARDTLASFKKKRRKYENGESYKDPHSCFFCMKVYSGGKNLRFHIFQVHLKQFGHLLCSICPQRFFFSRNLRGHMKMHNTEYSWVCEICKDTFKFSAGLKRHMQMHQKESNFRCDVCHKNFKLQADLRTHCMADHSDKTEICNVCKAKLVSGYSVYLHCLRHSGTRDHTCDICDRSFKRKHALTEHKKTHSSVKKDKECPVCKKKVTGRGSLLTHLSTFHQEYATAWKAKFKCNICDKPFCLRGNMENHIKVRHVNETREQYQKRNAEKQRRKSILTALNISDEELARFSEKVEKVTNEKTGKVSLRCKMCAQTYFIVSWMEKHIEDHKSGKLNVCRDCGSKFKSKYHLFTHRNDHCHGQKGKAKKPRTLKPRKQAKTPKPKTVLVGDFGENVEKITDVDGKIKFMCKICPNRKFQLVRAMKKHLQEHKSGVSMDKTVEYFCEDCGKCFKTKKRLQLHQKISHQKLMSDNTREADFSSSINDESDTNPQKKTRKRKQKLPIKLSSRGKRSAALNAKSILHLTVQEASSDDDDAVVVVPEDGSDFEVSYATDKGGEQ